MKWAIVCEVGLISIAEGYADLVGCVIKDLLEVNIGTASRDLTKKKGHEGEGGIRKGDEAVVRLGLRTLLFYYCSHLMDGGSYCKCLGLFLFTFDLGWGFPLRWVFITSLLGFWSHVSF